MPDQSNATPDSRDAVAYAVCATRSPAVPEVFARASGTTVLGLAQEVVRVAVPGRSPLVVQQLGVLAEVLNSYGVPTPHPVATYTLDGWEVGVWQRLANSEEPQWGQLGRVLRTLHDVPVHAVGLLPTVQPMLERGSVRVERYAAEFLGLAQQWQRALARLEGVGRDNVVLHGDATVGNVLWGGPRWPCVN